VEVWEQGSQLPEANGGVPSSTLRRFYRFLFKFTYLDIFWAKFLLKNAFFTERDHFEILKHTACIECVMSVECRLRFTY